MQKKVFDKTYHLFMIKKKKTLSKLVVESFLIWFKNLQK